MNPTIKPLAMFVALGAMAVVACTEGTPPPKTANNNTPGAATILQAPTTPAACPLGVEGARVVFDETEAGATLTFVAGHPDRVAELRERARDAAAMHGPAQKLGKGHGGMHGSGGEHGLKAMQLPAVYAGEDDIDNGARIRFTAVDPKEVDTLRYKLRERARAMMRDCE